MEDVGEGRKLHGKRGLTSESRGRGVEVHPLVQAVRVVSDERRQWLSASLS